MKPDFEKMADALARTYYRHFLGDDLLEKDGPCQACPNDALIALREAYAAGYRDGQERMRKRTVRVAYLADYQIEEPPT